MPRVLPLVLLVLTVLPAPTRGQATGPDLSRHFRAFGARGCVVGFHEPRSEWVRHGGPLCEERFVPASTFKILNSLVSLETGAVDDESEVVEWDGVDRGWSEWNRDHDLASAFRHSAVWVYRKLARRVGRDRMARWVRRAEYGSGEIGPEVDRFWLDGPLTISPEGQVRFLRRLARDDLPFSPGVMETVRRIMVEEEGPGWVLRAKTGWGRPEDGDEVGWKVGWVERDGRRFFFAVLIRPPADGEFPMRRAQGEISRRILEELGVL